MPATAAAARRVAAARASAPAPLTRPRPAPRPTRRPTAPRRTAPARTRTTRTPRRVVPAVVGHTATAVAGLADSGLVFRLTRGRLWIGLLTALLVGIVALNVMALSLSASATRVGQQADVLDRQNSALRARIASGLSNDRVQKEAQRLGYVVPEPGLIRYLKPGADDAATAAKRLGSGLLSSTGAYVPPSAPATGTTAP